MSRSLQNPFKIRLTRGFHICLFVLQIKKTIKSSNLRELMGPFGKLTQHVSYRKPVGLLKLWYRVGALP